MTIWNYFQFTLIFQKEKFEYNRLLLDKISNKKFKNEDFLKMGQNVIETIQLNSIKDNKKFEINAVELLYTLPVNSFTLINDDKDNIYLTKIKKFNDKAVDYVKAGGKVEAIKNKYTLAPELEQHLNSL